MMNEQKKQDRHIEDMTTQQIIARITVSQLETSMFLYQLIIRASIQEYTEQQHDELLTLIQEALTYLEDVPTMPEWEVRRNELIARLKRKV